MGLSPQSAYYVLAPMPSFSIDLSDPQFRANPYPIFARLRAEAPVCEVAVGPLMRFWAITRYDDVVEIGRAHV